MLKDKLESLGSTQATRRSVLKGLLVGLGAGVLAQVAGGAAAAQEAPAKTEKGAIKKSGDDKGHENVKAKGEEPKKDKAKSEKTDSSKASKGEKKKTEEPKAQHKK